MTKHEVERILPGSLKFQLYCKIWLLSFLSQTPIDLLQFNLEWSLQTKVGESKSKLNSMFIIKSKLFKDSFLRSLKLFQKVQFLQISMVFQLNPK